MFRNIFIFALLWYTDFIVLGTLTYLAVLALDSWWEDSKWQKTYQRE